MDWGAGDVSDPRGIIFGYYHNFMGRLGAFKSDCLFEGIFSIRSFFFVFGSFALCTYPCVSPALPTAGVVAMYQRH